VDKELKIAALSLIALLAIIAIMQPVISSYDNHGFSELAVLGSTQFMLPIRICNQSQVELGNYPGNVTITDQACLFGYIENHEGYPVYYEFVVKLGNESTSISNTTATNAPIVFTNYVVVQNNQSLLFRIGTYPYEWGYGLLSPSDQGMNQRLIFELWSYNMHDSAFVYTGIWNEIWLNVTI
jgi:uncharacterized membrane protein